MENLYLLHYTVAKVSPVQPTYISQRDTATKAYVRLELSNKHVDNAVQPSHTKSSIHNSLYLACMYTPTT